jgi:type VI secretion system protein ImpE
LDAEGQHEQAAALREQAFEQAPAVAGNIDGNAFEWIADADPRIGPCLEIIVNGGYSWVPFSRLSELKFEAPSDLRDKIWVPTQVTWSNGGKAIGFIPGRYAGSELTGDPDLVLGRRTDWIEQGEGLHVGLGQRMLATDAAEYSLFDARLIAFDAA